MGIKITDDKVNKSEVFIDGEAGTTGLGIRRRLELVPGIELRSLPATQRKDPSARQDMMAACGLDPSFLIGAELRAGDARNAHLGAGDWLY